MERKTPSEVDKAIKYVYMHKQGQGQSDQTQGVLSRGILVEDRVRRLCVRGET